MTAGTEQARRYGEWTSERRMSSEAGSGLNRRWTDFEETEENDGVERRARGLGWFSIGLGLAQVGAPRALARFIGISDDEEVRNAMFALGLREITSGIGLLTRPRSASWVWGRVGGDIMDLALLGKAMNQEENDRTRLAAATAAVVGVTIVDFMTGQQLSRGSDEDGFNGQTGYQARQTRSARGVHVKQAVTINRPRPEVYGFWHNFENLPRFMAHLESVEVRPGGQSHWVAKAPVGSNVEWDAQTTEDRPNEMIAWRALPDSGVPNWGRVQFRDAPGDRGTEVVVELRYQPPGGRLGALVAKLFGEEPDQQVKSDLRRFKQVMETGEIVHSDASIHSGTHAAQPPENLEDVELLGSREASGV